MTMNLFKLNALRPVLNVACGRFAVSNPKIHRFLEPRPTTYCLQRGKRTTVGKPRSTTYRFDYDGDLQKALPRYDLSKPRLEFEDSIDLPTASDDVKKVLSLEFGTSNDLKRKRVDEIIKAVQEHPADVASLEIKIAKITVEIRNQIQHSWKFKKDKVSKSILVEKLQARKKYLKFLRLKDKEKFDWLLKELKIKFVPYKFYEKYQYSAYYKPTKATTRKSEAVKAFMDTKKEKLDALEKEFRTQKAEFKETKEREMAAIEKELKEMGVNTSVDNLEELFREMGLGPPYVAPKKGPSKMRWKRLQKKFEKWEAEKLKNTTPLQ